MRTVSLCVVVLGALVLHSSRVVAQESAAQAVPSASMSYSMEPGLSGPAELRKQFTAAQIAVLEMVNRADADRLVRLPQLVVPQTWSHDHLAYSPFPRRYAWRSDAPKLLVVDQAAQAFAAYEHGALVRWGPVSSGREALPTPAGLFALNWRSRGRHSTVDPDWFMPWYFNFHNTRGLSFHEYALPGRPASHACVRLLERDARWLFDWGETWTLDEREQQVLDPGTPVLILNCYDFDHAPPWRSLEWLSRGVLLPETPNVAPRDCIRGEAPTAQRVSAVSHARGS